MKLGIIGAMSVEVALLKERMENLSISNRTDMEFYDGTLEGLPVTVVVCGVGKVNAALCVQVLCDCYHVTHIVNTGVAGSLCADLDIGDLVISTEAMYHDFDCHILNPKYVVGQVPGLSVRSFAADSMLASCAMAAAEDVCAGHIRTGIVASGDQFICDQARKEKIIADTAALCTEMEGAAIGHASWRNGIPFVVIRAISDKADNSAQMDYPTFEAIAAKNCASVTCKMAKYLKEMNI